MSPDKIENILKFCPDSDLFLIWSRSSTDSCLDRLWTNLKNIFQILSRPSPDSSLVPDKNLDTKKSRLWTKSGLVPMMDTSAPKYDLVVLSRTEYKYDRKNIDIVRVSKKYDHFD